MPVYIWFNLFLLSGGHWTYIVALETLEQCQELKHFYERTKPGDYYCFPVNVNKT